jgi:3'-phosphoadenosine 5'-phosphosulfate sulfotransferase (PAPS reductase)/FAD synthetase
MFKYRNHKTYIGSVFSFGAGTQSTAIMALIKHEPQRLIDTIGHIPNYAIFADTGAESRDSLINFEFWRKESAIPLYRVKNWKRNALNNYRDVPVYMYTGGSSPRQCTSVWKIQPIYKAVRKLYPNKRLKNPVAMWLGISCDEITRMKESYQKSIENVFPLIELGLDRQDCYSILNKYGYKAVKSACYMCPYQVKRWHENPELDKAIAYEKEIQRLALYREIPYLHPSCLPLEDAVKLQINQTNLFTFDDECDGVCGL